MHKVVKIAVNRHDSLKNKEKYGIVIHTFVFFEREENCVL